MPSMARCGDDNEKMICYTSSRFSHLRHGRLFYLQITERLRSRNGSGMNTAFVSGFPSLKARRRRKKRKSERITREIVTSGAGSRCLSLNYYYSRLFFHSLSLSRDDLRVINFNLRIRILCRSPSAFNATLVPDERSQRFRLNEA